MNKLTVDIKVEFRGRPEERAPAGRESRGKCHLCFKEEDSGLFPGTYEKKKKKKSPGESVPGAEYPWDTSQVFLGTLVIRILIEKYFLLQTEDVLNNSMPVH